MYLINIIFELSNSGTMVFWVKTRNLPIEALITLAKFYHTSTDYILGLTSVKTPYPKNHTKQLINT